MRRNSLKSLSFRCLLQNWPYKENLSFRRQDQSSRFTEGCTTFCLPKTSPMSAQSGLKRSTFISALRISLFATSAAMLSGCALIPSAGPLRGSVEDQSGTKDNAFDLVDVTQNTIKVLSQRSDLGLAKSFGDSVSAPDFLIGPGDALAITIWEAGAQPLFASTASPRDSAARGAVLPELTVDSDGGISVPFAGRIQVAGKSLLQIQNEIKTALAGKAANPQVLVSLARSVSQTVTVIGEGVGGGRIPLSPHGERLLDVLASAGGVRAATYDTQVSLTRGGMMRSVPLARILGDSKENVFLHPGDILCLTREPETFTAFGAAGRNAQISFDAAHVNLIEAVAKAGGLQDLRADPRGVFLFRKEPKEIAGELVKADAASADKSVAVADATVPVVYRLDLNRINSYFLGSNFAMRDGDVIYIADAPANDLQKFLQLLGMVTQPVVEGAVLHSAVK